MAYTKESYESSKKYKEKCIKRVPLDMQIELYEQIKQCAASGGESINGWIKMAIREKLERMQADALGGLGSGFSGETLQK